jgi:hypothetical protein
MKTMNHEQAVGNPDDEPMTRKELATIFQAMGALVKKEVIDHERPSIPVSLKPEFIRVHDAVKLFGIGRGKLYEMMSEGKIKSVSLRSRGAKKGTRLIPYDHLKAYLDSLLE